LRSERDAQRFLNEAGQSATDLNAADIRNGKT
jgi:hypothetical protein